MTGYNTEMARTAAPLESLLDVFHRIARPLELEEVLDLVLEGAEEIFGARAAALYVLQPERERVLARRSRGLSVEELGSPFDREGLVGLAMRGREPLRSPASGLMAAPILGARGDFRGALVLDGTSLGEDALGLVGLYASGAAAAIERALLYSLSEDERRLDRELAVARRVMAGLLPRSTPSLEGFEIAVVLDSWHEVGGDYYDFIPLGNDRWAIAIADVVGKGIPAALLVAALRASLYSLASQELALRALFSRANRFFHEAAGSQGKFVTLFYAVLDLKARRLIYVNAGHLPPVLLRSSGQVELLQEGGLPLGPFEAPRYFEEFAKLGSGDLMLLYTDGITEAMDDGEDQFGIERLVEGLRGVRSRPAAEICDRLLRDVKGFSGSQPADDRTLLIVKAL